MGRSIVRRGALAAVLVLLLTAAGCGDDEEPESTTGDGEDPAPVECATDLTATYPDGTEVSLDNTAALALAPGAAYTIYAADFDVQVQDSVSGAVPAEGGNVATLAITTFNAEGEPPPVEEGATIDWTTDFGVLTFSVVLNQDTTVLGNTAGGAGTLEIVALDDEQLCLDVDYSDDEKALAGTIAAGIL